MSRCVGTVTESRYASSVDALGLVGPILLGYYLAVGVVVGLASFVFLAHQGLQLREPPGQILEVAVFGGIAATLAWPWVVKVIYDDNGNWRG